MNSHSPVMLNETIHNLNIKPNGIYVDATFGQGGHSKAILNFLSNKGRLIALDKDINACQYAKESIKDSRFDIINSCFSNLKNVLENRKLLHSIDGLICDLGLCSTQLENLQRGFSFLSNDLLDMRIDTEQKLTLKKWLEKTSEYEITRCLLEYGQEREAKKIAREIKNSQKIQEIETTKQLVDIILKAKSQHKYKKHPATKSFLSFRLAVNDELNILKAILIDVEKILSLKARLVIISFHSTEDRIVKNFIKDNSMPKRKVNKFISNSTNLLQQKMKFKNIGRFFPTNTEIQNNPRARSAVMRVVELIN